MAVSFDYDVFLSYSSKDKPLVLGLARRLRDDGLRVWLDDWEIKPGDAVLLKIQQGLERSRILVIVMTKAFFDSDWGQFEHHTILFRDPMNVDRRFIPLLAHDCDIPATIGQFQYINWRNRLAEGYTRLLNTITQANQDDASERTQTEPIREPKRRQPLDDGKMVGEVPKRRPKEAGRDARVSKDIQGNGLEASREPSTIVYHKKVLRDAVHDLISLESEDRFILDLIDTKEFQRLRRIRQLGLAYFVYPCAEHSRFVHSLGVFNFARRMISQLLVRHQGDDDDKAWRALDGHGKTIKAAALLHDLGHGPFSHVFERVFDKGASSIEHEEWTCRIIRDEGTDVHKQLVGSGIDVNDVCALVWDKAYEKYDDVAEVPHYFIRDIVSSQLDADRMDYLLRDSLLTGARYGRYDSEWIMNALAIGEPYKPGKLKLCLDASKGTGAINEFLIARLLMTEHVYGHKTTRAYESELVNTLRLAADLGEDLPEETPVPVRDFLTLKGSVPVKTYLMLDDEVTWWALRQWAAWKSPPSSGRSKELAEALQRHALRLVRRDEPWGMYPLRTRRDNYWVEKLVKRLDGDKDMLAYECFVADDSLLPYKNLDVSLAKAGEDNEEAHYDAIFLLAKDGSMREHGEDHGEPLIEALTKERTRYRFFYDRKHKPEFARLLKEHGVCLV